MLKSGLRLPRLLAVAGTAVSVAALFAVPYHVPVSVSVSQSYRVGFHNHLAVALFLLTGALFCLATGGLRLAPVRDRPLPRWTLPVAVLIAVTVCVSWYLHRRTQPLGQESGYLINRQVEMMHGLHLYRDLEFIYGPLLVLPGYWLDAVLHLQPRTAYMASWVLFWAVGVVMQWLMIAALKLPMRHRLTLFAFFFLFTLGGFRAEGAHYTPLRIVCAGCLSVLVAAYWQRRPRPGRMAAAMVAAIALGFLVSPEQGTALGLGLSAFALLQGWRREPRFPWSTAALVPVGAALIGVVAREAGMFRSMHGFAVGGNNFPLLPSPVNLFFLAIYLCAIGYLYGVIRTRDWDSPVMVLGLCGLPMVSSALGRCDVEHLTSAVPLFLLGVVWLSNRPWPFRLWLLISCYFFLDPIGGLRTAAKLRNPARLVTAAQSQPAPAAAPTPIAEGPVYLAPFEIPFSSGQPRWGARSGYFYGTQNILTVEDIRKKANEIADRHAPYLLLPDTPGTPEMRFWRAEQDIQEVRGAEGSPWPAPAERRPLPDTAAVTEAILEFYVPTAQHEDGWRVWERRQP